MTMNKAVKTIGIIIGVLIIAAGLNLLIASLSAPASISVGSTIALDYTFGADFYTEMYGVTYKAVKQLNNLGYAISAGVGKTLPLLKLIASGISVLVMSFGAAVTGFFALAKAAETAKPAFEEHSAEGETDTSAEAADAASTQQ